MNFDFVITRHQGLVDYLLDKGVINKQTKVMTHVTDPVDLYGKNVIGVLPINLAAVCNVYAAVSLKIPADLRGKDLTKDQVAKYQTGINCYDVSILPKKHSIL